MPQTRIILAMLFCALLAFGQENIACLDCHTNDGWTPLDPEMQFDHNRDTQFTLVFAHADLLCTQCHVGENREQFHEFKAPGVNCLDCHQDVHQNYWGSDCETCHSPETWDPEQAYREHDLTLFPLVAAHHKQSCYLCHTTPYKMPSLDCAGCHETDFLPELGAHEGLTARTDCSMCHAPTRWDQILAINHDGFFPIYSGEHRGRWNSCSTCHTNSADYQSFTCFGSGCHSISGMDREHCEGSSCERCDGLTYPRGSVTPEDCYFCHPRGNESKCGD